MRYSIIAEDSKTIINTRYVNLDPFEVNKEFKIEELMKIEQTINLNVLNGGEYRVYDIFRLLDIKLPDKDKRWIKQHDYKLVKGVVFELFNTSKHNIKMLSIDWL